MVKKCQADYNHHLEVLDRMTSLAATLKATQEEFISV